MRAEPEPCFHCGATQTYYGHDTMQECSTCELFCCESCGEYDADWTGDHWVGWVTCKACPPGAIEELDRAKAEHAETSWGA